MSARTNTTHAGVPWAHRMLIGTEDGMLTFINTSDGTCMFTLPTCDPTSKQPAAPRALCTGKMSLAGELVLVALVALDSGAVLAFHLATGESLVCMCMCMEGWM